LLGKLTAFPGPPSWIKGVLLLREGREEKRGRTGKGRGGVKRGEKKRRNEKGKERGGGKRKAPN